MSTTQEGKGRENTTAKKGRSGKTTRPNRRTTSFSFTSLLVTEPLFLKCCALVFEATGLKHLWDGVLMVSRERGPAEPRSMYSWSRRRRDRDRRHAISQAQAQSNELKRLLWHRPRDDVAGATGQADVHYVAPETTQTGCGDPPSATPSCDTSPKLSETANLQVNALDWGSIDLTSSSLESISYVGRSSVDATSNTESGDPLSAAPSGCTCSKLGETAKLEVNTFASETGNFELTGRGLESISCLGNDDPPRAALLSYIGSKLSEDPPSAAPSGYRGSKLGETVGLNTFASDTGSLDSEGSNL